MPPVVIMISENTSHIKAIEMSISDRRPYLDGRNAKASEQAKENIALVAVMSVVSSCEVTPEDFNIEPR